MGGRVGWGHVGGGVGVGWGLQGGVGGLQGSHGAKLQGSLTQEDLGK